MLLVYWNCQPTHTHTPPKLTSRSQILMLNCTIERVGGMLWRKDKKKMAVVLLLRGPLVVAYSAGSHGCSCCLLLLWGHFLCF